jgi:hypothetical protein
MTSGALGPWRWRAVQAVTCQHCDKAMVYTLWNVDTHAIYGVCDEHARKYTFSAVPSEVSPPSTGPGDSNG